MKPTAGAPLSERLAHRLGGAGPPVVFANGGMMSYPAWEPVAAALRDDHATLLFDFRGQLLSPGEPPADLAGLADDLAALLDAVGWESAHVVGTSFGALVALTLAARSPERVRSLLLATVMDRATPAFDREAAALRERLAGIARGGDREAFYDLLVAGVYSEGHRAAEAATLAARRRHVGALPLAWFAGLDRLLAAIEGFDLTAGLSAVRCPACVVVAEADRVMDPARSRALAAALGAELAVHPTAGHALVNEDPIWLAATCRGFLARAEEMSP